ncbi:PLP-dependent transferase [Streptomyces sp. NPDC047082]|uniref:PLP-dependent transferase n=1 Tax=Streptomyces sp. NPDC047082 TaxID=3155259 RepID=UPI0033C64A26
MTGRPAPVPPGLVGGPRATAGAAGYLDRPVTQPITTTHHGLEPAERAQRRIADSLIRPSVGPEDADGLIDDLPQAVAVT